MDISSHASPRSFPVPQHPAPLALSDFLAQAVPRSDATGPTDEPAMSRSATRPSGSADEPRQVPARDRPRVKTPQQPPHEKRLQQEKRAPPSAQEEDSPPPTDWLATRQQLLPRRNQGKKADWIRGWSQAVSSHGDETYCACSESVENGAASHRGRKPNKTSVQLADNVRAILQRAGSPSSPNGNSKLAAPPAPEPREVCPYCSRPPSPPPPPPGRAGSKLHSPGSAARAIGKRFSRLLARVCRSSSSPYASESAAATAARKGRNRGIYGSGSSKSSSSGGDNVVWPENCQPPWATTRPGQSRRLARPASQPLPTPVGLGTRQKSSRGPSARRPLSWGRMWPDGSTRGAGARRRFKVPLSPSPSSSSSSLSDLVGVVDSKGDPARHGLSRSASRLQRAAALLQRTTAASKD
ncbi:hypothetical protein VTH06DRAFT_499 [Thermothelomyces fergusii]